MSEVAGVHWPRTTSDDQRTCRLYRQVAEDRGGKKVYIAQRCGGMRIFVGMTQDSPYLPMYICEECGAIYIKEE